IRRDLDIGSSDVYLLLAVSGLCFPLFIKTLWPYYFLDIYMLLALWWLAQWRLVSDARSRIFWLAALLLPAGAGGLAQLAESVLSEPKYGGWTPQQSLMVFVATAAFTALLLALLWLGPRLCAASPHHSGVEVARAIY